MNCIVTHVRSRRLCIAHGLVTILCHYRPTSYAKYWTVHFVVWTYPGAGLRDHGNPNQSNEVGVCHWSFDTEYLDAARDLPLRNNVHFAEARCLIMEVASRHQLWSELLDKGRPGPAFRNKARESSQSNATDHSYTSPVKKNLGMSNSDGDCWNKRSAPKGEVVQYGAIPCWPQV